MTTIRFLCCWVFLLLFTASVEAATVWSETVDGELSDDPLNPTAVVFALGTNTVLGSVELDHDFITFTVAPGQVLTEIQLVSWVDPVGGGDGNTGYGLIDDGASSVIPSVATSGDFLGGSLLNVSVVGVNLLDIFAASTPFTTGGTGFVAPLGAGTYTYLTRQGGADLVDYEVAFVLASVPVPPAVWLFGSALLVFISNRRRA